MNRPCPPGCDHCESQAEARKDARDEPLSDYEQWQRENAYEREMERTWP